MMEIGDFTTVMGTFGSLPRRTQPVAEIQAAGGQV